MLGDMSAVSYDRVLGPIKQALNAKNKVEDGAILIRDGRIVGDKVWSGYNYYLGDAASRIEINADLPIYTERAIDLGCHEGYPGHHVYNALLEKTFVTDRGWVEMSVYPLYSPMSLIAEGSAEYGVKLAFPGEERAAFEHAVLYPMAGLEPSPVQSHPELEAALHDLEGVYYTIADDYLSGRVDRETTIQRMMRYQFAGRSSAEPTSIPSSMAATWVLPE